MDALWRQLKDLPFGKWLFTRIVGFRIPYTGTMRSIVLKLDPGDTEVLLRDRRLVRNHLNSIHAIALANLGEFTGGLAVLGLLPPKTKFIITSLRIDYLKKARGDLIGKCKIPALEDFRGEKKMSVVTDIFNSSNETVARATADWVLRREA
jgi:acyl-coenzyme A thioesterase PaaI-like protein